MAIKRRVSRIRRIADSSELDTFILLVILFNCVTMAFPPKRLHKAEENPNSFFFIADYVLIGIFDIEFFIKFWSYGLSYFKDAWNWLDFAVVMQGSLQVITLIPGQSSASFADLSALRMMRVLRPLKSLRKFPEMRLLVGSLFGSFNLLLAIMMLTAMVIFCFGTFGSLYFNDALDYRCVPDPYWDPFYGEFTTNPYYNESDHNGTNYWESKEASKTWEDIMANDGSVRENTRSLMANKFWLSLSRYSSFSRDAVPNVRTYPYVSNFCGFCPTCNKCETCYSDDPADGCDKTMDAFKRRYGSSPNIKKDFYLDANGTYRAEGDWTLSIDDPEDVKYVKEYCIDIKKGNFRPGIDFPGPARVDSFTPLEDKSYDGLIMKRRGNKLDIKNEDLDLQETKHAYQEANCYSRGKKHTAYLDRTGKRLGDCKEKKRGSLRDGFLGDQYPRSERLHWYLGFESQVYSLITLFNVMNMESWNDAMWSVQEAAGVYTWPYFFFVIGLINICLLNLFPAVMSFNLRKAIRDEELRVAFEAKAQFMGDEMVAMTAFEEHMVDILAAEEEELAAVRAFVVNNQASTGGAHQGIKAVEIDILEGLPLVPQFPGAEALRNVVRPDAGYFNIFIYLCIFGNILCLASQPLTVDTSEGRRTLRTIYILNTLFTMIFLLEIFIKLAALGPVGYFIDGYNCFDFLNGMLGALDFFLQNAFESQNIFGILRVVRMARIARVLRIAGVSKVHRESSKKKGSSSSGVSVAAQLDFARLMGIISSASIWIFNVLGLLGLTLYMASIVSMQFFGGEVYALNDYSGQWIQKGRLNFDTFSMSLMTNFIILTGDSWQEIMYETMDRSGAISAMYFILFIIISKYAILSMLIAVIFDQVERDSIAVIKQAAQRTMISVYRFDHAMTKYILRFHYTKWYLATRSQFEKGDNGGDLSKKMGQVSLPIPPKPPLTRWQKFWRNENSYMVFEADKQPRLFLVRFAYSSFFQYIMLIAIMASVIILGLYYQIVNQTGKSLKMIQSEQPVMQTIQVVCLIIFVIEFVFHSVAQGFFVFLSDGFNVLDTIVTSISLISLGVPALAPCGVMRMIRIIRPLKKLARSSPAVTSILVALENSSRGLRAVGALATLCWCTIAVIGLQLFQGRLFYCSAARYPQGMLLKNYEGHKDLFSGNRKNDWPKFAYERKGISPFPEFREEGNSEGCDFVRPQAYPLYTRADNIVNAVGPIPTIKKADYNFDNFWEAFKSAFVMFTFDDWHKLVLQVINSKTTSAYLNHEAEASTLVPTLFFIVAGCSSFIITCLFVGVIYGTFTYQMLTQNTKRLASLKQAQWTVYEAKLGSIKPIQEPREPRSNVLLVRIFFRVFRHKWYRAVYAILLLSDVVVWFVIVGSQVRLAPFGAYDADAADSKQQFVRGVRLADTAFATFLLAEFSTKLMVFGFVTMLSLPSEQFRAVLMIPIALYVSLEYSQSWDALEALDTSGSSSNGVAVQKFVYALRTSQVFLVIPMFVELRMVVLALKAALGTTAPMMVLMTMVTFAFAVIGMVIFGWETMDKYDSSGDPRIVLSYWSVARLRFTTIQKSMGTLFISATANNWVTVRDEMAKELPKLYHIPLDIFWFAYILLVRFLFLNVCTLIFIYQYESSSPLQPWIAMQQVKEFLAAWQHFDEFGVGRIRTKYLSRLLRLLAPPLGLSRDAPQQLADRHARRVLMAMPPIMEREIQTGVVDLEARWKEVRKPFYTRGTGGGEVIGALGDPNQATPASKLPRYVEFAHVIKAVHRVVMFPELQRLQDDSELAARREFSNAKLDILRLAVNRFSEPHSRTVDASGNRVPMAVFDMALMQRVRPEVFRYRLRQALTLETHRWAKQIEFSKFTEESFHECELLRRCIKEERLSAQMQLEVMNRLAARGLLMSMQERRPKLHRHVMFLSALLQRIESVRTKHVRKAWLEQTMEHVGSLPVCARGVKGGPQKRAVSSIACNKSGDLLVCAHGGSTITVWKRRKARRNPEEDVVKKPADVTKKEDPWKKTPFHKTQSFQEDLGTVLVVTMTRDGKRFFSTAGSTIRGWLQAKKVFGQKGGPTFFCESIMLGHTMPINALRLESRHLFSVGDDGVVKIWRLRGSDALQSATVSSYTKALSVCCVNTAAQGAPERDRAMGHHALVGMEDGTLSVLPFSLKQQWLQGAIWDAKFSVPVFPGHQDPITCLAFEYRNVYCGSALGNIAVLKMVAGTEDMETLEFVADRLERLGFGNDANVFNKAQQSEAGAKLLERLQQIVRLEPIYNLTAHTAAITGMCMGGGVFFSTALDMALVSWKRATAVQEQPSTHPDTAHALAAHHGHIHSKKASALLLSNHGPKFAQKYGTAQVTHKAAVTGIAVADDFLLTADADGFVLVHKAAKYREVIHSSSKAKPNSSSQSRKSESKGKKFLEEEILEKPRFFHQLELAKTQPRLFLAHILAHYYPINPLKKPRKHANNTNKGEEGELKEFLGEESDDEYLDDYDFNDNEYGMDEYGEGYGEDDEDGEAISLGSDSSDDDDMSTDDEASPKTAMEQHDDDEEDEPAKSSTSWWWGGTTSHESDRESSESSSDDESDDDESGKKKVAPA